MDNDEFSKELTESLNNYFPSQRSYYDAVTVLALLWEEDDLGVIREVQELSKMFCDLFSFGFRQFVIPTDRAQAALSRAVSDFVYDFGCKGNLIIIYYGGHGDPDLQGSRQAWITRKTMGGPTLRWHHIQPILEGAEADVVLLLDCCYGGQAARARSAHKVELIAAAAMNLMTPGISQADRVSFTKALLTEIPVLLEQKSCFSMTALHRHMLRKEVGLEQQPFYAALFEDSEGSIILKPLQTESSSIADDVARKESNQLLLRLSMFEKPNSLQKNQVLRWLTTLRPSTISYISVEEIVSSAEDSKALGERLIQMHPSDVSTGNWLSEVSAETREDIESRFHKLTIALTSPISCITPDAEDVPNLVEDIKKRDTAFRNALNDCLLDMSPKNLQDFSKEEESKKTGFTDLISMRLMILNQPPSPPEATSCKVVFQTPPKPRERIRFGEHDGKPVIVEYWYYTQESSGGSRPPVALLYQVKKIAALHSRVKPVYFRTLSGCGFVHEVLPHGRFGIVYDLPPHLEGCYCHHLSELFKVIQYVPLEVRVRLARNLAIAIMNFHVIGWLHKGLKSQNILVFHSERRTQTSSTPPTRFSDLNFASPIVIGFDYSRPEEAESALSVDFSPDRTVYRHPERWGSPARFLKKHELYALGVLLLEIGLWRPIATLDPSKREFRGHADPFDVKKVFLRWAGDRLAHTTGERYAAACRWCLECESTPHFEDKAEELRILRSFRENVIDVLCD